MDIKAKIAQLEAQRNAIISQIVPALQQISAIDGQLALLQEMQKESESEKEKKE